MNELSKNLSAKINAEHEKCVNAGRACLHHALEAGRLLVEAKAGVEHGQWLPWLESNFKGSSRAAQMYMRFHDNRDRLEAAGGVDKMGIGQAMSLLSSDSAEPADLAAYLESHGIKVVRDLLPSPGCERVGVNADQTTIIVLSHHPQEGYVHWQILTADDAVWNGRAVHWAMLAMCLEGEGIDLDAIEWNERPATCEPQHRNPMEAMAA